MYGNFVKIARVLRANRVICAGVEVIHPCSPQGTVANHSVCCGVPRATLCRGLRFAPRPPSLRPTLGSLTSCTGNMSTRSGAPKIGRRGDDATVRAAAPTWCNDAFAAAMCKAVHALHVDVVREMCQLAAQSDLDLGPWDDGNSIMSPLIAAATVGQVAMVRCLCELPAHCHAYDQQQAIKAVTKAAKHGHLGVVKYLYDLAPQRGVDLSTFALGPATQFGQLDVLKYLCEAKHGLEAAGELNGVLVSVAARSGFLDVVKYLCELPAQRGLEEPAWSPIMYGGVLESRNMEVVRYVLGRREHVDHGPQFVLPQAALAALATK